MGGLHGGTKREGGKARKGHPSPTGVGSWRAFSRRGCGGGGGGGGGGRVRAQCPGRAVEVRRAAMEMCSVSLSRGILGRRSTKCSPPENPIDRWQDEAAQDAARFYA